MLRILALCFGVFLYKLFGFMGLLFAWGVVYSIQGVWIFLSADPSTDPVLTGTTAIFNLDERPVLRARVMGLVAFGYGTGLICCAIAIFLTTLVVEVAKLAPAGKDGKYTPEQIVAMEPELLRSILDNSPEMLPLQYPDSVIEHVLARRKNKGASDAELANLRLVLEFKYPAPSPALSFDLSDDEETEEADQLEQTEQLEQPEKAEQPDEVAEANEREQPEGLDQPNAAGEAQPADEVQVQDARGPYKTVASSTNDERQSAVAVAIPPPLAIAPGFKQLGELPVRQVPLSSVSILPGTVSIPRADSAAVSKDFEQLAPQGALLVGIRARINPETKAVGALQTLYQQEKELIASAWAGVLQGDEVELLAPEGQIVLAMELKERKRMLLSTRLLFGAPPGVQSKETAQWSPWIGPSSGEKDAENVSLSSDSSGIVGLSGASKGGLFITGIVAQNLDAKRASNEGADITPPALAPQRPTLELLRTPMVGKKPSDEVGYFQQSMKEVAPIIGFDCFLGKDEHSQRVSAIIPIYFFGTSEGKGNILGTGGGTRREYRAPPHHGLAGMRIYLQGGELRAIQPAFAPFDGYRLNMKMLTLAEPFPSVVENNAHQDLNAGGSLVVGLHGFEKEGYISSLGLIYWSPSKSAKNAKNNKQGVNTADAEKKVKTIDPKRKEEITQRRRKQTGMRQWKITDEEKPVEARFVALRANGQVLLRDLEDKVIKVQLEDLSPNDQLYVKKRSTTKVTP